MADPPLYAALLLIQLNFAIGAVAAALALPKTEPLTFALIREVSAAALLTAYAVKQGAPAAPPRGSRGLMARLGACACATQVLAIVGLKLSADPTAFALWQPAQPVAVAAASILLRWDRPDAGRVAGVVLAAVGCYVATTAGTGGAGLAAHGCFAAAAAAGAAYQLVSKPATRRPVWKSTSELGCESLNTIEPTIGRLKYDFHTGGGMTRSPLPRGRTVTRPSERRCPRPRCGPAASRCAPSARRSTPCPSKRGPPSRGGSSARRASTTPS